MTDFLCVAFFALAFACVALTPVSPLAATSLALWCGVVAARLGDLRGRSVA